MEIGLIGLGEMGFGMARRLAARHDVVAFDLDPSALARSESEGVVGATSLEDLVGLLRAPRTVLVMVPPGAPTRGTLDRLAELLSPGDVLVNGGNSHFDDAMHRAPILASKGIDLVDMGTSGGVQGAERGYALMVGGREAAVLQIASVLDALSPAPGQGWAYLGASGAGHYTKMVHNQVKHGMVQAYAEGLTALSRAPHFDLDLAQVMSVWSAGAMARSALLELTHRALVANPALGDLAPYVADSARENWTSAHAVAQLVQRGLDREQIV